MERKWRVLIVVCVAVFMLLLDITVVNVALPQIEKELHTSFTDLQWVVDAYALTLAATMLNAGSLGDLLGPQAGLPRRDRAVHDRLGALRRGAVAALADPRARRAGHRRRRDVRRLAGDHLAGVPRPRARHGLRDLGRDVGIAVAIGPLVGGALTTYVGWRWIFFVNIPIGDRRASPAGCASCTSRVTRTTAASTCPGS